MKRKLVFLKCCPTEVVKALVSFYQQREPVLSRVVMFMWRLNTQVHKVALPKKRRITVGKNQPMQPRQAEQ